MFDSRRNPFDEPAHFVFEDEERGKLGSLEIRFVFFGWTLDGISPRLGTDGKPIIDTVCVLTKISGCGTTNIAKAMVRSHMGLIQERAVTELIIFHHWMDAETYSFAAKETMFQLVAHPLIRRRLKEARVLVEPGLLSTMVDAGLRLSGVKDAMVVNSEHFFIKDINAILEGYDQRPGTLRVPATPELIPR
jgi:hypothetical protein